MTNNKKFTWTDKTPQEVKQKLLNLKEGPKPYAPKIQTYLKGQIPPKPNRGIRYAIAQGPSVVPADISSTAMIDTFHFNLSTLTTATSLAKEYNAQLLTLPELFLSGYEFGDSSKSPEPAQVAQAAADFIVEHNLLEVVSDDAAKNNIAIVCPLPYKGKDPAGNIGYFDAAVVFDATGKKLGIQFKTHLWGFSERSWFNVAEFPATDIPVTQGPDLPHDEKSPYAPFFINEFPVGVGICYDAEFPEVARCLALNGSLLSTFPTAAPNSILPGETEPYPDISQHYIPANALQNLNFCSYSNRVGDEYSVDKNGNYKAVLNYTGNSIIVSPYGKALTKAITNEDTLLIADCIYCDYPLTQPADVEYLINRRPELCGYLTNKTVSFPFGKTYTYPNEQQQHKDPESAEKGINSCD